MIHSNVIILVIVCGACLISDVQLMKCSINVPLRRVHQFFWRDHKTNVPKRTAKDFKLFNDECEKLMVEQNPPPKKFNIDQPATRDSPRGRTSEVVRVKFGEKTNRKAYAVKRIRMPWVADEVKVRGSVAYEEVCSEMKILQEVNHPFIVKLHWSLWNEKYAVMIFDYYQMDSFVELIMSTIESTSEHGMSEEKAKFYTAQLVLAVKYLHEKHIVHRDIKCENILVDNEGYLKLTDFGFSDIDDGKLVNDVVGTINYAAPEILATRKSAHTSPPYSRKPTDIWSLGVVIYTMLFAKFPNDCDDVDSMLNFYNKQGVHLPEEHDYEKLVKNEFGEPPHEHRFYYQSEELEMRGMLQDMLKVDPKYRLTIEQIKDHDSWNTPSAWIKPGSNPPVFDWEALKTRQFHAPIQPSKDLKKYIDTESGYEFNKVVLKTHGA